MSLSVISKIRLILGRIFYFRQIQSRLPSKVRMGDRIKNIRESQKTIWSVFPGENQAIDFSKKQL